MKSIRERAFYPSPQASLRACGVGVILLCLVTPAPACNIPVFRYALERWRSDPYQLVLFHHGPLAADDKKLVDFLGKHEDQGTINFQLTLVDVSKKLEPEVQKLFDAQKTSELPWLVVWYPPAARIPEPVWSGRFSKDAVAALLDSPARQQIAKRILAGDSTVWLVLEIGDPAKDAAAVKLVQEEMKKLEKSLKLPVRENSPDDKLRNEDGLPLKLAFSMIRVKRDDPAERMLVSMLLHSEEKLTEFKEPMVFPIFGRGRALWAIVGKGIIADNLEEAGAYLTGACSCEVKQMNPGTDLLMSVDWEAGLDGRFVKDREPPPLTGIGQFEPEVKTVAAPETVEPKQVPKAKADAAPARPPVEAEPAPSQLVRNAVLAVLAALVLLAGAAFVIMGKKLNHGSHG